MEGKVEIDDEALLRCLVLNDISCLSYSCWRAQVAGRLSARVLCEQQWFILLASFCMAMKDQTWNRTTLQFAVGNFRFVIRALFYEWHFVYQETQQIGVMM